MPLTFRQLTDEVEAMVGLEGTVADTSIKRIVNNAARRVWNAKFWPERKVESIVATIAPYATGTVDVTLNSATLTGTTTVWTGFEKRKFALGLGVPYYRITTVGGPTAITLARNYLEASGAGVGYTIYQDEYDLPTTVEVLADVSVLYNPGRGIVRGIAQRRMDIESYVTGAQGIPRFFSICTSTTAGTKRIRIYPVPDAAYGLRCRYWSQYTDMSADGDTTLLGADKDRIVIKAACLDAQYLANSPPITNESEIQELIAILWRDTQEQQPLVGQRRTFDYRTGSEFVFMDLSQL